MNIISNIAVFAGAVAMLLITGKPKYKRLGLWLGLLVQPFWFYLTIGNNDWGMFGGTCLYTIAMLRGLIGEPVCVREKIWYAPMILAGARGVILKRWGPFTQVLYRDPLNQKCYKEWTTGEEYEIFKRFD